MKNPFRRLIKRSPSPPPQPMPPTPKDLYPSPLHIPELLERILFFLDEHTLATTAQLVSSQWHILSIPFLHRNANLDFTLDKPHSKDILRTVSPATRLTITEMCLDKDHAKMYDLLKATGSSSLSSIIPNGGSTHRGKHSIKATSTLSATVPLIELVVGHHRNRFDLHRFLKIIHPSSPHLTRLTLYSEGYGFCSLSLSVLLLSYPHLVTLELLARFDDAFVVHEPRTWFLFLDSQEQSNPEMPDHNCLESIHFRGVAISQHILEALLKGATMGSDREGRATKKRSGLKALRLWNILPQFWADDRYGGFYYPLEGDGDFWVPLFFKFLFQLPMELESFGFSLFGGRGMTSVEEFNLIRSMVGLEGDDTQRPAVMKKVKEWGFLPGMCATLAQIPNRITTLELVSDHDVCGFQDEKGLHALMCQATHLLHLKARSVRFRVLNKEGTPFYQQEKDRCWWACKGLKTLQLGLSKSVGFEGTDLSPAELRTMCGYLFRVCPQLEELEFAGTSRLDITLDCGLVLLARLQSLRTLVWESFEPTNRVKVDGKTQGPDRVTHDKRRHRKLEKDLRIIWEVIQPSMVDTIQQRSILSGWKQRLLDEEEVLKRGDHEMMTGSLDYDPIEPGMDPKYIGTYWDIKLALSDVEKDPQREQWWPRLSTLKVRSDACFFLKRIITLRQRCQFEDRIIHHPIPTYRSL